MNRSILIVICDFLLISLLAFSTVDEKTLAQPKSERRVKMEMNVNGPENRQDLAAVLKLALDDEQRTRDQLLRDLNKTREVVGRQQATLSERDELLAERNRQIQEAQQTLQARDQEARRLAQEKETLQDQTRRLAQEKGTAEEQRNRLAQERNQLDQQARNLAREKSTLEQQVSGARSNLQALQQQLSTTRAEALVSREQTEATRDQLRQEQEKATALQQQMAQLEKSNQVVQAERQRLAGRLQVAEAERRAATEQATRMQDEVKVEREEKARLTQHADKLADGVKVLAQKSEDLAREVQENRPSAANTIFSEFVTNRIHARFLASRAGFLGMESNRRKETEVILATDGTNYCAICHVEDAAVVPANPAPDWETVTGTLSRGTTLLDLRSMSFSLLDPRVVLMPLTAAEVRALGCKVYRIAKDPFKFQEAVLVGAREGYYGECKFELDLTTPQYLKMDRSVVRGLFGKFNPTRGDLVLSRTGELLGVMANNAYCCRLYNFQPMGTIRFGNTRDQHTGELLSRLQITTEEMAFKLR